MKKNKYLWIGFLILINCMFTFISVFLLFFFFANSRAVDPRITNASDRMLACAHAVPNIILTANICIGMVAAIITIINFYTLKNWVKSPLKWSIVILIFYLLINASACSYLAGDYIERNMKMINANYR